MHLILTGKKCMKSCSICYEYISYRVFIKKGQKRSPKDKNVCAVQKAQIQATLWERLSLKVDKPKLGGCGNSNNGNTIEGRLKILIFLHCVWVSLENYLSTLQLYLSHHSDIF